VCGGGECGDWRDGLVVGDGGWKGHGVLVEGVGLGETEIEQGEGRIKRGDTVSDMRWERVSGRAVPGLIDEFLLSLICRAYRGDQEGIFGHT
jgi:hypothetical protein